MLPNLIRLLTPVAFLFGASLNAALAEDPIACNPPASSSLNVRPIPQHATNWCWAASAQMILQYLGNTSPAAEQCAQANAKFQRKDCCDHPIPDGCDQTGWPEFENFSNRNGAKLTYRTTSYAPLSKEALEAQLAPQSVDNICRFSPFAFSWQNVGGSGHMMVATGYKVVAGQLIVLVNDPRGVDEGSTRELTYEEYVSSTKYTHWNDYYDIK